MEILKNHNSFTTERERQQRDILIAAIDNLVDFAAAEEYAMLGELPETADEQDMEAYEKICRRYNLVHAEEENNQVFFAASMAAWWMAVDMDTVLTYMTQGDERTCLASFIGRDFLPQIRVSSGADTADRMGMPLLSGRGGVRRCPGGFAG